MYIFKKRLKFLLNIAQNIMQHMYPSITQIGAKLKTAQKLIFFVKIKNVQQLPVDSVLCKISKKFV